MIKYLGSKRRLVPALAALAAASGARTALDLFCGTTRVSQAFKSRGIETTAVDSARCAHVLARCYVASDPGPIRRSSTTSAGPSTTSTPCPDGRAT